MTALWQHCLEVGLALGRRERLLARRSRLRGERMPAVLVPGILGVHLADERGRAVWGPTRRLYAGPPFATAPLHPGDLLRRFPLVPPLWEYDVYGGLLRFLCRVGGYRLGEDLFFLSYDWRGGISSAAEALAALLAGLRGIGDERVDLIGVSSGGLIIRRCLVGGSELAGAVHRVVHVGTPQLGSFHALRLLQSGVRIAPLGRLFSAGDLARCQTVWDSLPVSDEPFFIDPDGEPLPLSLYDPQVVRRLRLLPDVPDLEARLRCARETQQALAAAVPPLDTFIIGARHRPTVRRVVVRGGRAELPTCAPRRDDPLVGHEYEPGDGSVGLRSLLGLPGHDPLRSYFLRPAAHHRLPSDPETHRLVLEALLAADRPAQAAPAGRGGLLRLRRGADAP